MSISRDSVIIFSVSVTVEDDVMTVSVLSVTSAVSIVFVPFPQPVRTKTAVRIKAVAFLFIVNTPSDTTNTEYTINTD